MILDLMGLILLALVALPIIGLGVVMLLTPDVE